MPILQYSNWQHFEKIIQKAKIACENTGITVIDHFTDLNKMVQIGSVAYRYQIDYQLTRYAYYSLFTIITFSSLFNAIASFTASKNSLLFAAI